jgi:CIC family chloride channel protein
VPLSMSLKNLAAAFERTHHHGFVVIDDEGYLAGIVSLTDLESAMLAEEFETHLVGEIAVRDGLATGYPDETISDALWRMGNRRIGRLPIVDRQDPRKLVGVLRREDIIHAYEQVIANRKSVSSRLRELRAAHEGKVQVIEVDIGDGHIFEGKTVQDMAQRLPHDCILVSIRRNNRVIIPHGDTIIQKGDHLVTLASETCAVEAERVLH